MALPAKTELFAQWLSGTLVIADQGKSTGRRVFLHSVTGVDEGGAGASPDVPCATLDYAIALCTANKNDIIYVMPGHVESEITAANLALIDIDGISIIGMGNGADIPTFSLGHANATITVSAVSVLIKNIRIVASIANVAIGLTVAATADNLTVEDCQFADGGTDVLELAIAMSVAVACDDLTVKGCSFLTVEGGTITSAIDFVGASDNSRIINNLFNGDFGTAAIENGAAATRMFIAGNNIKVKNGEPGIELHANTTGIIADNNIESTGLADPDAAIVAADCSWFENYVVVADGAAAQLIGTAAESVLAIGTVFAVKKTVTKTAIVAAALDLTGVSSGGTLELLDCILQNDTTEVDSAGHAEVIEFRANNVAGSTSFMTIAASVLASEMRDLRDSTTGFKIVLETGKKVTIQATTEDVTSVGTCDIYLIFRRLAAGATIAAA